MKAQDDWKIDITKTFKMIMIDKDLKQYEVGKRLGYEERQPFHRILQKNDHLRLKETLKIANALNCDVKIILCDRDTGKEWKCDTAPASKENIE